MGSEDGFLRGNQFAAAVGRRESSSHLLKVGNLTTTTNLHFHTSNTANEECPHGSQHAKVGSRFVTLLSQENTFQCYFTVAEERRSSAGTSLMLLGLSGMTVNRMLECAVGGK